MSLRAQTPSDLLPNDETRAVVEQLKKAVESDHTLDLSHCDANRNSSLLRALRKLTAGTIWDGEDIVKLDVSESAVDDATFAEALSLCPSIVDLEMLGSTQLSEAALADVGEKCPKIENIYAQDCAAINDKSIGALASGCTQLKHLCISQCQNVTSSGFITIATKAKQLEWLEASECRAMTDHAVSALLSCCRNLMWLDISSCPGITDDVLDSSPAAGELQTLYLRGNTQLTDKALDVLLSGGGARKLEDLDVAGCHGITARFLSKLQAARPSLNIVAPEDDDIDDDIAEGDDTAGDVSSGSD